MKEINLQQIIRVKASQLGAILWRNNVGACRDKTGRMIFYGLCKGSSDLIGIFKGRFLAVELKVPGKKPTAEQEKFIEVVKKAGGIAGVVTNEKELEELLNDKKNNL